MELATEDGTIGTADEATIRAIVAADRGFNEFLVLSRSPEEFVQAGYCLWVARSTGNEAWLDAFGPAIDAAALAGTPEPDLFAVEFRESEKLWAVRQVFAREQLLELLLRYLRGGDEWRSGLTWEELSPGPGSA